MLAPKRLLPGPLALLDSFEDGQMPDFISAAADMNARGWVLPNAQVDRTTVVAPGAAPHAVGSIKTPPNAYASLYPDFQFSALPVPFIAPWLGGNFWDGRAEGCGETAGPCPVGKGVVSATIKPSDLPASKRGIYAKYLGPTADQALNPFPNPVEQNIPIDEVCREVQFARYRVLYPVAFGERIAVAGQRRRARLRRARGAANRWRPRPTAARRRARHGRKRSWPPCAQFFLRLPSLHCFSPSPRPSRRHRPCWPSR